MYTDFRHFAMPQRLCEHFKQQNAKPMRYSGQAFNTNKHSCWPRALRALGTIIRFYFLDAVWRPRTNAQDRIMQVSRLGWRLPGTEKFDVQQKSSQIRKRQA
jgi:hypothetical protein